MSANFAFWQQKLDRLAAANSVRDKRVLNSAQSTEVVIDNNTYLNFASNDYLGLANDTRVIDAGVKAFKSSGVGSGASHMVIGHHQEHELLTKELAVFTRRDRALLFSTGYMANLAVSAAFCTSKSLILQDKLNHASLIDGARLSGARSQRYLHNDISNLELQLQRLKSKYDYDSVMISTDGVFSMDGDIAKLDELAKMANEHQALLVADDAHGLGVVGEEGRGSLELFGISQNECDLLVGTFGKAFGTSGAFVAGSSTLIDYLEQVARPHIYTTALPPAIAAATRCSLSIVQSEPERRKRLAINIDQFRYGAKKLGLNLLQSETAIQGIVVGTNEQVLAVGQFLSSLGTLTGVIRPPTVPNGSARLRITITSEHQSEQVERLLHQLGEAKAKGLIGD